MLIAIDSVDSVQSLCKHVTLLDCIGWIVKAWKDVKVSTIEWCFSVAGLSDSVLCDSHVGDDEDFEEDDVPLATLAAQFTLQMHDIHQIDNDTEAEDSSEDWKKTLTDSCRSSENCDVIVECELEDVTPVETPLPGSGMSHSDVLLKAIKLKNFAQEKDPSFLELADELKTRAEKKMVNLKCAQKQTKVDSFFKK